jgi:glutamate/tyrosine decarboxylase-like PLP-dependent enzyme
MSEIRQVLGKAHEHAAAFLESLDGRSIGATANADLLRGRLAVALAQKGIPPSQVIDEIVTASEGGHLGSAGGRFFAWVIGGALPSALAADWLVSTWDNNAVLYACGPASAIIEEIAGTWIKDLLRLPADASFAFTTGCQMAHFTCLAAARNAVLRQRNWDVERLGLAGAPRIRVLANQHRHGSVDRAMRFLGFGTGALEPIATGADARLSAGALKDALRGSGAPAIVILNAADLNIGAVDPFSDLISIARAAGAWVHVDGAFGLWARTSSLHGHKVAGVEEAHSWATDAHKWLNTPKDIGIAIVRDREAHRAAMGITAAYISPNEEARDQIDWTPDWTRRARGIPVYAAIRELGREGIAAIVDHSCSHAEALAGGIAAMEGARLVAPPTLNQALVRFLDPKADATEADHDQFTLDMVAAINEEGTAFFSSGMWGSRRVMRISVVNWRTSAQDVEWTLEAVSRVLSRMRTAKKDQTDSRVDSNKGVSP